MQVLDGYVFVPLAPWIYLVVLCRRRSRASSVLTYRSVTGFINGQPPTADRGRLTLILILLTDTYFM